MAAETSAEAMIPVNLAILKMNILMLYDTYEVCLYPPNKVLHSTVPVPYSNNNYCELL